MSPQHATVTACARVAKGACDPPELVSDPVTGSTKTLLEVIAGNKETSTAAPKRRLMAVGAV